MDEAEFDDSDCAVECTALCEHFEEWYRTGMSDAWKKTGDGLRGIRDLAARNGK